MSKPNPNKELQRLTLEENVDNRHMSSVRVHIEHVTFNAADDYSQKSRFVNSTLEGRKNEVKKVTIVRAGSTASVEVEIFLERHC